MPDECAIRIVSELAQRFALSEQVPVLIEKLILEHETTFRLAMVTAPMRGLPILLAHKQVSSGHVRTGDGRETGRHHCEDIAARCRRADDLQVGRPSALRELGFDQRGVEHAGSIE